MWRDDALLLDMLIHARRVQEFNAGVEWEQFVSNKQLQSATQYGLLVIGEAASKISRSFRDSHPEIAWVPIIGLRHRLVHDYLRIELPKVWRIVTTHVPALIQILEPLVPPENKT